MTDEAFIKAIIADPDDDAVRLVYADWLEENGDEAGLARAALIRSQFAAEKLKKGKERSTLEREARAIIKANPSWAGGLKLGRALTFRLGFPHRLTLSARMFVQVAKRLFAAMPTLRAIKFPNASNEVEELAACPDLARLSDVDLSDMCQCGACPIHRDLAALFASPHTGSLVTLRIAGDRMGLAGTRRLAASASFPMLRELDLSDNSIGNAGSRALLAAEWLGRLKRIDLRRNGITDRAAESLRTRFGDAVVLD